MNFTAEIEGNAVHHELLLDGFTLGIATKESTKEIHGLTPGKNSGSELVLWVENADTAIHYLMEKGAVLLSEPLTF